MGLAPEHDHFLGGGIPLQTQAVPGMAYPVVRGCALVASVHRTLKSLEILTVIFNAAPTRELISFRIEINALSMLSARDQRRPRDDVSLLIRD